MMDKCRARLEIESNLKKMRPMDFFPRSSLRQVKQKEFYRCRYCPRQ